MEPAEAETVIPEIRAFLEFLKREHRLSSADGLLKKLDGLEPGFGGHLCMYGLDSITENPASVSRLPMHIGLQL